MPQHRIIFSGTRKCKTTESDCYDNFKNKEGSPPPSSCTKIGFLDFFIHKESFSFIFQNNLSILKNITVA